VLADKVLISYSLEALVPSAGATSTPRPPQKLSGNRDVVFFSVGTLKERTLLVYMKKKANESVFRALEPVINAPHAEQQKGGGGLLGRFARDNKSSDWFRIYKTFFIPSEAYSMQFLRSKLCIVCARGFEIMNLDSLLPGTIPDFSQCARDDPRVQMLAGRVERSKPLGMFKNSESEFLLCYDAFACYVDRLGEPVRLDNIIEWEGTPHSVAFRAPYVLAFDTRFVEIRDSASGQLVQLIRANDLRYVSGSTTQANENEASIILSQRKRAAGRLPYDFQHVFGECRRHPCLAQPCLIRSLHNRARHHHPDAAHACRHDAHDAHLRLGQLAQQLSAGLVLTLQHAPYPLSHLLASHRGRLFCISSHPLSLPLRAPAYPLSLHQCSSSAAPRPGACANVFVSDPAPHLRRTMCSLPRPCREYTCLQLRQCAACREHGHSVTR